MLANQNMNVLLKVKVTGNFKSYLPSHSESSNFSIQQVEFFITYNSEGLLIIFLIVKQNPTV